MSIDGLKESHDRLRGEGVFDKVIETVNKYPEKKLVSLTTLSRYNVDDVEPMCEYFSSSSTWMV